MNNALLNSEGGPELIVKFSPVVCMDVLDLLTSLMFGMVDIVIKGIMGGLHIFVTEKISFLHACFLISSQHHISLPTIG